MPRDGAEWLGINRAWTNGANGCPLGSGLRKKPGTVLRDGGDGSKPTDGCPAGHPRCPFAGRSIVLQIRLMKRQGDAKTLGLVPRFHQTGITASRFRLRRSSRAMTTIVTKVSGITNPYIARLNVTGTPPCAERTSVAVYAM